MTGIWRPIRDPEEIEAEGLRFMREVEAHRSRMRWNRIKRGAGEVALFAVLVSVIYFVGKGLLW